MINEMKCMKKQMKKYEQIKRYLPPTEICDHQPKQESTLKYCLGYSSEIFTRSDADISK